MNPFAQLVSFSLLLHAVVIGAKKIGIRLPGPVFRLRFGYTTRKCLSIAIVTFVVVSIFAIATFILIGNIVDSHSQIHAAIYLLLIVLLRAQEVMHANRGSTLGLFYALSLLSFVSATLHRVLVTMHREKDLYPSRKDPLSLRTDAIVLQWGERILVLP